MRMSKTAPSAGGTQPDHHVFQCTVHQVWWYRSPAELAAQPQAEVTGRHRVAGMDRSGRS